MTTATHQIHVNGHMFHATDTLAQHEAMLELLRAKGFEADGPDTHEGNDA